MNPLAVYFPLMSSSVGRARAQQMDLHGLPRGVQAPSILSLVLSVSKWRKRPCRRQPFFLSASAHKWDVYFHSCCAGNKQSKSHLWECGKWTPCLGSCFPATPQCLRREGSSWWLACHLCRENLRWSEPGSQNVEASGNGGGGPSMEP